ncbi:unnamed protein product, partial [Gongylonema pulchrum]|uniref:CUT domain-containing protein n=1 Tax=Gongylonema pulchrum TaxID=637853 RepID=A0A183DH54_9BILA
YSFVTFHSDSVPFHKGDGGEAQLLRGIQIVTKNLHPVGNLEAACRRKHFRSQGTLSDLLRNPKPWSKLKSGRETFRRMAKWLQEPELQRMAALRLAGMRCLFHLHCDTP